MSCFRGGVCWGLKMWGFDLDWFRMVGVEGRLEKCIILVFLAGGGGEKGTFLVFRRRKGHILCLDSIDCVFS